jgi:hypothetical protein
MGAPTTANIGLVHLNAISATKDYVFVKQRAKLHSEITSLKFLRVVCDEE